MPLSVSAVSPVSTLHTESFTLVASPVSQDIHRAENTPSATLPSRIQAERFFEHNRHMFQDAKKNTVVKHIEYLTTLPEPTCKEGVKQMLNTFMTIKGYALVGESKPCRLVPDNENKRVHLQLGEDKLTSFHSVLLTESLSALDGTSLEMTILGERTLLSKTQPYLNLLNCKAQFIYPPKPISCFHLALQYARDSECDEHGKVNMKQHYSDEKAIAAHLPATPETLEDEYKSICMSPPEGSCVIARDEFALVLKNLFAEMEMNGNSHETILLMSDDHALAARLRIKPSELGKTYVVSVYDPNDALPVRLENTAPDSFPGLSHFMRLSEYDNHYQTQKYIAAVPMNPNIGHDVISEGVASPDLEALHLQMFFGLTDGVHKQVDKLGQIPESERAMLLCVGGANPDLYVALKNGHVKAISAWLELLKLVPENEREELLKAKNKDGHSGLDVALNYGRTLAISSWLEGLTLVSEGERTGLLRREDGRSALSIALGLGDEATVRVLIEALLLVPESERAGLLRVDKKDVSSGMSLVWNKKAVEDVWLKALEYVPENEREALRQMVMVS